MANAASGFTLQHSDLPAVPDASRSRWPTSCFTCLCGQCGSSELLPLLSRSRYCSRTFARYVRCAQGLSPSLLIRGPPRNVPTARMTSPRVKMRRCGSQESGTRHTGGCARGNLYGAGGQAPEVTALPPWLLGTFENTREPSKHPPRASLPTCCLCLPPASGCAFLLGAVF